MKNNFPRLFVALDDSNPPRLAGAHVREKHYGTTTYRYLQYRDGPTVRTVYIGSVAIEKSERTRRLEDQVRQLLKKNKALTATLKRSR